MLEDEIYEILTRVLLAGRLPAGTKLGEHKLAELFAVTRERIRKILQRLGHERLITIVKNRGAFTIAPDPQEIRTIYEARRILEGGIVAHLAEALSEKDIDRIRRHMDDEVAALAANDRTRWQRLSADFHMMLAEMTQNPVIIRQAQELVGRTIMLVRLFEPHEGTACGCDEHRAIFRALAGRERSRALRAMSTHLSLVETRLRPRPRLIGDIALETVVAEELAAFRAGRNGATDARRAAGGA